MKKKYLLGCDWGTSSFRLWLFDMVEQRVVGQLHTREGIANTHKLWESQEHKHRLSQEQFFRSELSRHTAALSGKLSMDLREVGVVMSGMASSSIGMQVIPYADLPFALDGSGAVTRFIERDEDFPHDIVLVSGVRSENDVMRGEETQVLGLIYLLEKEGRCPEKSVMLFPGTHCKHVFINGGEMASFQTFMTGEIYSMLGHHSILRDSVDAVSRVMKSVADIDAFRNGVRASLNRSLLNAIFSVRTNHLFDVLDKHQNSFYLSGLLIGSELQCLQDDAALPIILCSSSNLHDHYTHGLEELGLLHRTTILSSDMTEKATIAGQFLLWSKTTGG